MFSLSLPLDTSFTASVGPLLLFTYLLLVRLGRWKRYNDLHRKFKDRDDRKLTVQEAQSIIQLSTMWDMPLLMDRAVSLALFKTYGIPSISKLLWKTKELGSAANVSKRYSDTAILITNWMLFPVDGKSDNIIDGHHDLIETGDPRGSLSVARTNWLHSHYDISNDDFLYTLCLFVLEPISWAKAYGWRPLSELEEQAFFIYWLEIGKRMAIKDIPETLEELQKWSTEYEETHMVPAESNNVVGELTINEMLHAVPERMGIRKVMAGLTAAAIDDHVRNAMMLPEPSPVVRSIVKGVLSLTFKYIPHVLLPRRSPNLLIDTSTPTNAQGRMNTNWWQAKPWYKPTPSSTIGRVFARLSVRLGLYDDLPSEKYHSSGYRIEELGPCRFQNMGHAEVLRMAESFHGCPIKAPYALVLPSTQDSGKT